MISWTPDEVERRFALLDIPNRFSAKEKHTLTTTDIVAPEGAIICFATPIDNKGLNILILRKILGTSALKQPSFFDHPWYLEEAFAQEDCAPGWHFLHSDVLPESISQPINYISSLGSKGLELPSAIEVILMLFLHYAGTAEQLLQKKHTWCRDHASMNRFVTVGAFGRNGLFVSGHPAEFASRGLGICARVRR
jgi:hypothetical protein